jgi:hypothetical protein
MALSRAFLRSFVALSALAAFGAVAARASADEEFDVAVAGGHVTVTAKGTWHINKEYPWRLVIGETTIDKGRFTLSDTSASVDSPKGSVKIKGGVCNGDQCLRLDKTVTVP